MSATSFPGCESKRSTASGSLIEAGFDNLVVTRQ